VQYLAIKLYLKLSGAVKQEAGFFKKRKPRRIRSVERKGGAKKRALSLLSRVPDLNQALIA
jgi:hypothetical protein